MSDEQRDRGDTSLTGFPVELSAASGLRGWLDGIADDLITGWAIPGELAKFPITLVVVEAGREVCRIYPSGWRQDIADVNQGDGRSSFSVSTPMVLRDGQIHHLDVREGDVNGPSVLTRALTVRLTAHASDENVQTTVAAPAAASTASPEGQVKFSFVINFYNMKREAERTLTALTSWYQRDAEDIFWEVLCVDNGSNPPLDEAWIRSFGPQFRLVRPSKKLPSPCFALNEAVRSARGEYIALMIDGAHVVSPGVVREAADALAETPRAIVGLRQWFFGGDQRWLSAVGYTREQEDIAFGRIGWPANGYRLFEVSTPMMPSPNTWFDGASESNCLFISASLFGQLGGYDETFDTPGGGLSNLDLFSRAADVADAVIMLIGEASFHQFHGGTTTNVDDYEKDALVRAYMNDFTKKRGHALRYVAPENIRYRGHMPTEQATITRQRPIFSSSIGVTRRVRSADSYQYFDSGAERYLVGFAAESGIIDASRWLGEPTGVAAGDLSNLQEIIRSRRPSRVIAVNQEPGLLGYVEDVLGLIGIEDAKTVCVGSSALHEVRRERGQRVRIGGPTCCATTLQEVRRSLGAEPEVLVIFRADDVDDLPVDSIRTYMQFVSAGSLIIVTRTAFEQPWLGYSRRWSRKAIQLLTLPDSEFRVDHSWERHLVTACPWGYLRRVYAKMPGGEDDASLDDLALI